MAQSCCIRDVLRRSLDEFNRLKDEIDLSNFRREAALCLEDLYEKHKRQQGAEDHFESLLS